MIVAEEPAQARAAMDATVRTRRSETFRRYESIVKTLVIPFPVVVGDELSERLAQGGFPRTTT